MQGNATRSHAKVPGTLLQDSASGAWYLTAFWHLTAYADLASGARHSAIWHPAILVQSAQQYSRHTGPPEHFLQRIRRRKNHNVAVVATARKLAVFAWRLLTTDDGLEVADSSRRHGIDCCLSNSIDSREWQQGARKLHARKRHKISR